MDLLEGLFDFGDRKRRNGGGFLQNDEQDDHHHEDHDHPRNQYPPKTNPQGPTIAAMYQPGAVCRNCSTQTVMGAKFCHGCGAAIELIQNCASCGSKLPTYALFCPQCGYKSG
jgi:ribosomal protein L40E